jgi:hypothetical protein
MGEFSGAIDMRGEVIKGWTVLRKATDYERKTVLHLRPTVLQSYWMCGCSVCSRIRFFGGQVLRRGKVGRCKHK